MIVTDWVALPFTGGRLVCPARKGTFPHHITSYMPFIPEDKVHPFLFLTVQAGWLQRRITASHHSVLESHWKTPLLLIVYSGEVVACVLFYYITFPIFLLANIVMMPFLCCLFCCQASDKSEKKPQESVPAV